MKQNDNVYIGMKPVVQVLICFLKNRFFYQKIIF